MRTPWRRTLTGVSSAVTLAATTAGAAAQTLPLPLPENIVSLTASATVEADQDWLTIVLSTTREGVEAAAVQSQLKQALEAALAQARAAAQPGQIEVRTGQFALRPRYAPPPSTPRAQAVPPQISGWIGSAELIVEGRDIAAIAQLAGHIQTLVIARTDFSLSRPARDKVEQQVVAAAISGFRSKADAVSRQFGFTGYTVRDVNVSSNEPPSGRPLMRMQASMAASDAPLPVESGRTAVTATVSGSVQMRK